MEETPRRSKGRKATVLNQSCLSAYNFRSTVSRRGKPTASANVQLASLTLPDNSVMANVTLVANVKDLPNVTRAGSEATMDERSASGVLPDSVQTISPPPLASQILTESTLASNMDDSTVASNIIPVPMGFWDELDRRLGAHLSTQLSIRFDTQNGVIKTQIAEQLKPISLRIDALDQKIDREVEVLRTEILAAGPSGPSTTDFELLKSRVATLEQNEVLNRRRIEALESTKQDSLSRIEDLESQVTLVTEVAVGLIDHSRSMSDHITDIEGRTRRGNLRIYNVEEGAESNSSVSAIVGEMIETHLDIDDFEIERAHRSAGPPAPPDQQPRSIVVKFTKEKDQEAILKKAWANKGFQYRGKKVGFGRDNSNAVQTRINSFRAIKKCLQEQHITHRTGHWGQLVVSFFEPHPVTEVYWSSYEAYQNLSKRSIEVPKVKPPIDLAHELLKEGWALSFKENEKATREAYKTFVDGHHLGKSRSVGPSQRRSRRPPPPPDKSK